MIPQRYRVIDPAKDRNQRTMYPQRLHFGTRYKMRTIGNSMPRQTKLRVFARTMFRHRIVV